MAQRDGNTRGTSEAAGFPERQIGVPTRNSEQQHDFAGSTDDRNRSLEPTDRRRAHEPGYAGPERRLASRRQPL